MNLDLLRQALPPGALATDRNIVAKYRHDRARERTAGWPLAVVRATCTEDVQKTLAWASSFAVPVVPRGAGSGLSGGASAIDGGLVLSTERMRSISIDALSRVAVVQPGLMNAEVKKVASEHGLFYPPDPSSFDFSSIGGNAATNAGGLCCVKYGVTGDYILGMQVVTADGLALRLGGPRLKDVAGLSLAKLFIGSEGILGIITELTLRLISPPCPSSTLVATFPFIEQAADAVVAIAAVTRPSMLELMDRSSINAVEDQLAMGLDRTAGALLIARSDSPPPAAGRDIVRMHQHCLEHGAAEVFHTDDVAEGEAFAVARRAALPALERLGTLMIEDVGVALGNLPALVHGIERIAESHAIRIAIIAHAGDGNTHPIIVFDQGDRRESANAVKAFDEIMTLALKLNGTITGEHGIGRLKRDWLPEYLGEDVMTVAKRIKHALDPQGILNPGVILG